MGLKIIFDKRCANFKGIIELASNENLSVDSVIQKAFIEVNEWGTEAAAATGTYSFNTVLQDKYFFF
jgi:serine protease inhibitor